MAPQKSQQYQTFGHVPNDTDSIDEIIDNEAIAPKKSRISLFSLQFIFSKILYVITGLIIIIVLALIIFILIIMSQTKQDKKARFEFDDIFNAEYSVKSWDVAWHAEEATDGFVMYYKDDAKENHVVQVPLRSEFGKQSERDATKEQLMNALNNDEDPYQCSLRRFKAEGYNPDDAGEVLVPREALAEKKLSCGSELQFDAALRFFAFKTDVESVFRHSTKGSYIVYDRTEKKWINLSSQQKQKAFTMCSATRSYWVGEDNNVYMYNPTTNTHVAVTSDGDRNLIYNGISDWVYEEDVWGSDVLFTVSPDCNRIAYLRLNDSLVEDYHYVTYDVSAPYPTHDITKYPVAGSGIPIVAIRVATCEDDSCTNSFNRELTSGPEKDGWVFQLEWLSDDRLIFTTTDRIQTMQFIRYWDASTGAETHIDTFDPKDEKLSWVQDPMTINPVSEKSFVDIRPHEDYYHLRYTVFENGQADSKFITTGDYNVLSILGVKGNIVYFTATKGITGENVALRSTQQYVYQVDLTDLDKGLILLPGQDTANAFYSVSLSASGNSYVLYYQGPDVPMSLLVVRKNPQDLTPSIIGTEDNVVLRKLYSSNTLELPTSELQSVELNGESMDLLLMKPPNFREALSYPALLYFYGGPGSKQVTQAFRAQHAAFSMYMASRGFVVATLDNRGTGMKKASFMQCTYKKLGVLEAEDQMALKEYLAGLNFIDANNIMLWGWSFGGFLTLKTSTDPSYFEKDAKKKPFRAAIAVAPVTKWSIYNAAYTERFMQTPQLNPEGYLETSIIDNITPSTLNGTNFLLNHGTGDDNVHPLNAWNLVTQLQQNEVQFHLQMYPNKAHSLSGLHTQRFLYRKLSDHLIGSLQQES